MLRRRTAATLVAGALALAPMVLSGVGPIAVSANAAPPTVAKYKLGAGVKLTTYSYATGPQQVRVIAITQGSASLDVVKAAPTFGTEVKPSTIASTGYFNGTTYVPGIAATNGDFARRLAPVHLEEVDGQVTTTGIQSSPQFAMNADGSHAYIGNTGFTSTATFNATKFPLDAWNSGIPATDKISVYTPVGGTVSPPPGSASPTSGDPAYCAVRLIPSGPPVWSGSQKTAIDRPYTVDALGTSPCPQTKMSLGTNPDAVVLASAATGIGATTLQTLTIGGTVTLDTRHNGWPGVVDAIGGTPVLVNNGVNVAPGYTTGDPSIFNYQPRTAVGFNSACSDIDPLTLCKVFLVTVDGRQTGWSLGWQMNQLGNFFVKKLHVQYALNLDGGGGTVSWVHKDPSTFTPPCIKSAATGCLVDKPADLHGERAAIMALVAIKGTDLGVPLSLR